MTLATTNTQRLIIVSLMCILGAQSSAHASSAKCLVVDDVIVATAIQWRGPCANGMANGSGAILYTNDGVSAGTFYGTVKNGKPQLGVYDMLEGYRIVAIGWDADDPQHAHISDDAFAAASSAARALSVTYTAQHNTTSAAYYRKAAEQLNMALE